MLGFSVEGANDAWKKLVQEIALRGRLQESRDQMTRELLHVTVEIRDPRQRLVFARPMNPAFAIAETIWMLAGANDLSFVSFWNPRMKRFSDDGSTLRGAYGERLGIQTGIDQSHLSRLRHQSSSTPVLDQVEMAYETLLRTPHSRQVVLQIWNSSRDLPNPLPRSKNVPCNVISHLLVRDNKLEWLQIMRSNDLVWGFPYNIVQFTTLQEILAGWLNLQVGSYVHLSDSLHVYKRHWESTMAAMPLSDEVVPSNHADLKTSRGNWKAVINGVVKATLKLTELTEASDLLSIALDDAIPPAYQQWVALLKAEALRRRGYPALARRAITEAGNFWAESWFRWAAFVEDSNKARTKTSELVTNA